MAAASEPGRLVTNGMSCRARDGANINGGFLVGVSPADYASDHPLAGAAFQSRWEGGRLFPWGRGFPRSRPDGGISWPERLPESWVPSSPPTDPA